MTQAHPPFCRAASLVPGLARFASTALGDMQALITPAVCAALRGQGYAVVDGVLGDVNALRVRDEVLALRPHMHENCTHLVKGGATQLLPKQFILEAELQLAETQARAPLCARLQQDAALRTMLNLLLPGLRLERQAVKLQVNGGGGGCFPLHFDTAQGVDGRRVTAILYLNPGWAPAHGGQLRLYPFPAAHVDVAPLLDRLVLFSSQRMLHRVLPSGAPRCCATTWLSEGPPRGGGGAADAAAAAAAEREALRRALARDEEEEIEEGLAWRLLLSDQLRQHAAKLLYRDEWRRSLEEAHPPGRERDALLEAFGAEVGIIERALRPLLPALRRAGGEAAQAAAAAQRWL